MTILERSIALLSTPHALMVMHTFDKPKRWTEVQHHAVTILKQVQTLLCWQEKREILSGGIEWGAATLSQNASSVLADSALDLRLDLLHGVRQTVVCVYSDRRTL